MLRTYTGWNHQNYLEELLGALQFFGDETVSALADALTDPNTDLRILALKVLEYFEGDTEAALSAMIRALEDPQRIVRIAAVGPVAAFGEKAKSAVPILMRWLDSDDKFSRVSAIGHVLQIDPTKVDELLPILVEALESDDCVIQCQSVWLLGQLGELAREAVPVLKRMVDDENSFIRREAREALKEISGDGSVAARSDQSR